MANGRYRLLVFSTAAPGLQFWQALDTALDRQVALTFVDPDGTMTPDAVREILSRTSQLSRIDRPGIARCSTSPRRPKTRRRPGGLRVDPRGSLREVAETAPHPSVAPRPSSRWPPPPTRPTRTASRCRSTTPAGSG